MSAVVLDAPVAHHLYAVLRMGACRHYAQTRTGCVDMRNVPLGMPDPAGNRWYWCGCGRVVLLTPGGDVIRCAGLSS